MARTTKKQAATTPGTPRTSGAANGAAALSEGDIARRAYELFLMRNGEHGRDLDDWLRAEHELRNTSATR
jgi:hypothetical protein